MNFSFGTLELGPDRTNFGPACLRFVRPVGAAYLSLTALAMPETKFSTKKEQATATATLELVPDETKFALARLRFVQPVGAAYLPSGASSTFDSD